MGRQKTVTVDVPEGIDREGGNHQHGKHDEQKNNFQAHSFGSHLSRVTNAPHTSIDLHQQIY